MIRTKRKTGTDDVIEAVKHMRTVTAEINRTAGMSNIKLRIMTKEIEAPFELLKETATLKRLPVINMAARSLATPTGAALMMQLNYNNVFVRSDIFKSKDARRRAKAIVEAVTHFKDPKILAEISTDLGDAVVGINCGTMDERERLAVRGW